MTIANELSAEVAIALLVNRKGDPGEMVKLFRLVHLELKRLSSECHSSRHQRPSDLITTDSTHDARRRRHTRQILYLLPNLGG